MEKQEVTRVEILDHVESAFGYRALGREDIVNEAKRNNARPEVVDALKRLANDRPYTNVRDMWTQLDDVPVSP